MKKMSAVVLIALFAVVVGCNSSSDSNPTGSSTTVPPGEQEVLDGTFVMQEVKVTGNGTDVSLTPPAATGSVVVGSDTRFTATINIPAAGENGTWSGNYAISGNTLTLFYDDGDVEEWMISTDRRTVSGTSTEDGFTISPIFVLA